MYNDKLISLELQLSLDSFEKKISREILIDSWKAIDIVSEEAKIVSPVEVYFDLVKTNQGVEVSGEVKTKLFLSCSRCLEKFDYEIQSSFEGFYLDKKNEDEYEDNDEENIYFYENNTIDLTERVIEAIILEAPEIPLCKDDCKGLCSTCGENLNENPEHSCEDDYIDPRFAKLKDLFNE